MDVTHTDLAKSRAINLAGIGETVLDLAEPFSVARPVADLGRRAAKPAETPTPAPNPPTK